MTDDRMADSQFYKSHENKNSPIKSESSLLNEVDIENISFALIRVFIRVNSCLKVYPHRKIPNRLTLEECIHFPGCIES